MNAQRLEQLIFGRFWLVRVQIEKRHLKEHFPVLWVAHDSNEQHRVRVVEAPRQLQESRSFKQKQRARAGCKCVVLSG